MKTTSLQSEQVKSTTDDPTRTIETVDDAGNKQDDKPGTDPVTTPKGANVKKNVK